jgi:hypothetical protein
MFYIKQNDTSPAIRAVLKDADGVPVNVVGANVLFYMRVAGATNTIVEGAAEVVDGAAGIVQYSWASGDTATAGNCEAEFEVTYPTGKIETFPNSKYIKVKITPELS